MDMYTHEPFNTCIIPVQRDTRLQWFKLKVRSFDPDDKTTPFTIPNLKHQQKLPHFLRITKVGNNSTFLECKRQANDRGIFLYIHFDPALD
jgi:hypothetical protein